LFINKIDLLIGYDEAVENEIKEAYLPLLRELDEASEGVRFECKLVWMVRGFEELSRTRNPLSARLRIGMICAAP
jgi:hypothetical protein